LNSSRIRKTAFFAAVTASLAFGLTILLNSCENVRQLSFAPKGLGVSKILYVAEESSGFGPGGNETGVIVYELPENAATEIEKNGVAYLEKISQYRIDLLLHLAQHVELRVAM